jgi:hypothetical protein
MATVLTGFLLADDGFWVLLAFVPYLGAYFGYRGAIASAHSQGSALATVLDLDRFALYERLRLPLPADAAAERAQNEELMRQLDGKEAELTYQHPDADTFDPEWHGASPYR